MTKSNTLEQSVQARLSIDIKLTAMQTAASELVKPRGGWVKAIRVGLGMSLAHLAFRMKLAPSTVHRLEASEVAGTISLLSLQRFADELGCDLVYALVPKQPLEEVVWNQATQVAQRNLARIQTTMALEEQGLDKAMLEKLVANEARVIIGSGRVWDSNAHGL